METVFSILNSLTESEQSSLLHSLSYIPKNNLKRKNLLEKLAKFLLSAKKAPTMQETVIAVYGNDDGGKKILNLRTRLLKRVLDLLISEGDQGKFDGFDMQDSEWVHSKKKLAQFYYLFYSGRSIELSTKILNEVIDTSIEYEHYIVAIEALRFKKWIYGLKKGKLFFNQIQAQLKLLELGKWVVEEAVDLVVTLDINTIFQPNREYHVIKVLPKEISRLKTMNRIIKSNVASYYITVLELDYLMSLHKYNEARKLCQKQIQYVSKHKSVYRIQRLASVYCNLSRCMLLTGDYLGAEKMAQQAISRFHPNTTNYSIAKEQEFYAKYYRGAFEAAKTSITEISSSSKVIHGDFRHSQYQFYLACVNFQLKKYNEANKILNEYQNICDDKIGWDIAVRVLNIMCCIELNRYEQAGLQNEALRKHVATYMKDLKAKKKYRLIVSLFKMLENKEYDFSLVSKKFNSTLSQLETLVAKEGKQLKGPDLVPLVPWLRNHLKKGK